MRFCWVCLLCTCVSLGLSAEELHSTDIGAFVLVQRGSSYGHLPYGLGQTALVLDSTQGDKEFDYFSVSICQRGLDGVDFEEELRRFSGEKDVDQFALSTGVRVIAFGQASCHVLPTIAVHGMKSIDPMDYKTTVAYIQDAYGVQVTSLEQDLYGEDATTLHHGNWPRLGDDVALESVLATWGSLRPDYSYNVEYNAAGKPQLVRFVYTPIRWRYSADDALAIFRPDSFIELGMEGGLPVVVSLLPGFLSKLPYDLDFIEEVITATDYFAGLEESIFINSHVGELLMQMYLSMQGTEIAPFMRGVIENLDDESIKSDLLKRLQAMRFHMVDVLSAEP